MNQFRYMIVGIDGDTIIQTQDERRSHDAVTGRFSVPQKPPSQQTNWAKNFGAKVIVRVKRRQPARPEIFH
jgi:hypothetical protein